METVASFFAKASPILNELATFAIRAKATSLSQADHIGFKCASRAEFEIIRTLLERESGFIYQSIISGRPIAIIKLSQPLATALGPIDYLELSDQKPDGSQVSGFDHLEIVPKGISYPELITAMKSAGEAFTEKVRPHHTTYDLKLSAGTIRLEAEPLIEKIIREEIRK